MAKKEKRGAYDFRVEIVRSSVTGLWGAALYRGRRQVWSTGDGYVRRVGAVHAMDLVTHGCELVQEVKYSEDKTVYYYVFS